MKANRTYTEKRWALIHLVGGKLTLLSKYYWAAFTPAEPHIPTFPTRERARQSRRELSEYDRGRTRVVPVEMTIRVVDDRR